VFARQPSPPAGAIVRFETDRQKLSSAMQLSAVRQRLNTFTAPLIVTSVGDFPRPATSV
jgi:hypothetical protein